MWKGSLVFPRGELFFFQKMHDIFRKSDNFTWLIYDLNQLWSLTHKIILNSKQDQCEYASRFNNEEVFDYGDLDAYYNKLMLGCCNAWWDHFRMKDYIFSSSASNSPSLSWVTKRAEARFYTTIIGCLTCKKERNREIF